MKEFKKFLSSVLCALMLWNTLSVGVLATDIQIGAESDELDIFAEDTHGELPSKGAFYTEGGFSYAVDNGEAIINDFNSLYSGDLVIPDSLGGYTVTSIYSTAFLNHIRITSITIPDSVTSIGCGAFYGCTSLKNIIIPDSITSIGDDVFSNCAGLTSIAIPDSVTSIGSWAFYACTSLTSLTIPDSVTSIGDYAFYDCTSLTSITIPTASQA